MDIHYLRPADIERRSMELIERELKTAPPADRLPVIKRVIHATADFYYEENLVFSESAVEQALSALRDGALIVTDTNMALSGINKRALAENGCEAVCYMADERVARLAEERGVTRAAVSMEMAAESEGPLIFAVGNAPTALIRLKELIDEGKVSPRLVIGVPVGFVNVIESKDMIMRTDVPYIVARGRKGGSTVAAAICNALLYMSDAGRG